MSRYRTDKDLKTDPQNREEADYRNMLVEQDAEKLLKVVGSDKRYAMDVILRAAKELTNDVRPQNVSTDVSDDSEVL
jgi:hypothetical protein